MRLNRLDWQSHRNTDTQIHTEAHTRTHVNKERKKACWREHYQFEFCIFQI